MAREISGGTHQLWARVVWAATDMGVKAGMSEAQLFAGLPFDASTLRRRKHVQWDDYCVIVERIAEFIGGPTELEDLLESTYHQVVPELRRLVGLVVAPKIFMKFVLDVVDPLLFPPIEARWEELHDDTVRIEMLARPGVRPCEAWFRGSVGSVRGITRHLDLPPVEVLSSDIGPSHLRIVARVPESRAIATRARKATSDALHWVTAKFVLGAEPDGRPVEVVVGDPPPDPIALRVSRAIGAWKLSPRQAEVLALVVAGRANKEIAQALATAENTSELHVTTLLRKASVTSRTQLIARFWALDAD